MKSKKRILVVDDDTALSDMCKELLSNRGYDVDAIYSGEQALERVREGDYSIVITDLVMPGIDGIELMKKIKLLNGRIDVIVMTSYATVSNAVEAMKLGASDYITKPFKRDELTLIINKILQMQSLENEVHRLRSELDTKYKFGNIIGKSEKMGKVYALINSISDTEANLLIQGETGTGKELVAKAVHYNSMRKDKPFVKVDCASLTETLLESELFGHEKGAFTGATKDRVGRFRMADKGTIFLDEVSNIPFQTQAKLLRILQDFEFEAVGSDKTLKVDVRIIAASNCDLELCIQKGTFRNDLYYRLKVVTLNLPPLRERLDDISLLSEHFIVKYCKKNNRDIKGMSRSALQKLMCYHWPGNVRELENLIENAVVLCDSDIIQMDDFQLPNERNLSSVDTKGKSFHEMIDVSERRIINDVLNKVNWDKDKAAELLKISRASLYNKIKKHNIHAVFDKS
ncbi:MAG: sigma-54-dependent Fis family transcriptional regulator [Candidatus Scalindua sp. AMX11]|nr:MAG: sigma-54-dependent Fis family transcriptional regulator [Candidatus Scalindua sp.]NOG82867.1 sigma-54-dependent Fis family transcriptional regulator [Planctomycetota bacterium]RZV86211.1 MAG: sigma-54-dependent Fis family transcriptional regulator [Candidatus Scalindua sp. SCAELEC01]TDE65832.1 MAG: sigma-54-dependent Fis family transcriptional regulator [Candidatus Scalindua sp. AMX11]GJQ58338.1 MAG: acetoacetate metabolism regulatory protein AtoC [Candidatus Scalindua sp.]